MERLQKIISGAGIASRRAAEKMIEAGRVTVDGKVVREMGVQVDGAVSRICVDGKLIKARPPLLYFMLYKPRGYISTAKDERGRKTVLDLLPEVRHRIYPVGRLDGNTEGLLLLTNDGALMHGLLHPRREIEKIYMAQVEGDVAPAAVRTLRSGVALADGVTAPARVRVLRRDTERDLTQMEIILHEGKNRQVRRMCEAVGHPVRRLKRIGFAGLALQGLRRGEYRGLTEEEIRYLYDLAQVDRAPDRAGRE